MILEERNIIKAIDKKNFPFMMAGIFLSVTFLAVLIAAVLGFENDVLWMIGGTELLIYVIGNALCTLVVKNTGRYLKRTMVAYISHLFLMSGFIWLFTGNGFSLKESVIPIYLALIFCFIMSLALVLFIRQMLSMLKDQ
ncbi:MAG: hypothetical protein WAU21_05290 [Chitinophagales bacterium]|nr:hypothetical protein [Bacteroidota bacterium]MBK8487284.1 hypothetical protein [Bacteroidota bacterium]MBK8682978.1 hypothetical protein [Bacteroidota bacterium]MBP9189065.1 hypothetical protein [Chitinophagales bacterium]